jgi:hypothetical protein
MLRSPVFDKENEPKADLCTVQVLYTRERSHRTVSHREGWSHVVVSHEVSHYLVIHYKSSVRLREWNESEEE